MNEVMFKENKIKPVSPVEKIWEISAFLHKMMAMDYDSNTLKFYESIWYSKGKKNRESAREEK